MELQRQLKVVEEVERREKQAAEERRAREEQEARERAEREREEREALVLAEQERAEREQRLWEKEQRERAAAARTVGALVTEGATAPEPQSMWPCDACRQAGTYCEPPTGRGTSCQRCKLHKMLCTTKGARHSKLKPRKRGRDEVESEPEEGVQREESRAKGRRRARRSGSQRPAGVTPRLGRPVTNKTHRAPEDWDDRFRRLAERMQEAEDCLMTDSGALYLVGSRLLGPTTLLATHEGDLQELRDDINSIRQEVAILREDLGEVFQVVRRIRGERSVESEREQSDGFSETQLLGPDEQGSDIFMLP